MSPLGPASTGEAPEANRPVNVLGVPVRAPDVAGLIDALLPDTEVRLKTVLYANPHVLNTAYRDGTVRGVLGSADLVYVDGFGVQLAGGILGRRLGPRTTAADWFDRLCEVAADRGTRLYLLAGQPQVPQRAAAILQARHPALCIVGTHHGYIDATASSAVIAEINRSEADLLLVGMGTPLQEHWIAQYRSEIDAPVVWAIGALLDFVTGTQRRAPGWMARNHMEWLWRLGTDPGRLWRRYIVGNPLFLARVLRQRVFGLPPRFRS